MTQDKLDNELLHHIVHLGPEINSCELKGLPDKEYIVTGCLIEDNHLNVGLLDIDYSPDRPQTQWRAFALCSECMKNIFNLLVPVRPYDPIVFEAIVQWGAFRDDDPTQRGHTARVFVYKEGVDIPTHVYPKEVNEGDIFYQAAWIETDGKIRTQAWGLEPTQFDGKTVEEVYAMLRMFRDLIKSNRYRQQETP